MSEQLPTAAAEAERTSTAQDAADATLEVKHSNVVAWFALLLVLLLAVGIAIATKWWWPQWQQVQQQQLLNVQADQATTQRLEQQLADALLQQTQAFALQQQELASWQQQQRLQQQHYIEQLQLQVQALRQQIQQSETAPPQHWLVMEAHYLLKRASYNLNLQHDVASAKALLVSAEAQLAKLNDPALLVVRQAITTDLTALTNTTLPDITSTQLQLAQLRMVSTQLPVKQPVQHLMSLPEPDAELANWRANLAAYWQQSWRKLFQVRAAVPEDFYSLTQEQQVTVRLSLQQQFTLAEMALLQQQPEVFHAALRQASDLLQRYFVAENAAVQQANEHLVTLAKASVAIPDLPALQSLQQLERYLAAMTEASYE